MKARNFVVLITAMLAAASCRPGPRPIEGPKMTPVTVVLRISGAAHLVDKHDPPLIVMPNFTDEGHHVLLVATEAFVAKNGLPHQAVQVNEDILDPNGEPTRRDTFMYGEVRPPEVGGGIEIDLKASGATAPPGSPVEMPAPADDSRAACPDPQSIPDTSLHWLPQLSKVTKADRPLRLKDSFLEKDPDPGVVALRLELSGGQLEAMLTPQQRQFRFVIAGRPADDDVVQTVAMSLVYTFPAEVPEGAPFVLKGRKFGTRGAAGDLIELGKFLPQEDPLLGPTVEIDLMNIPPHDFFHLRATPSIPHFHLHYRLLDGDYNVAVPEFTGAVCASATQPMFECGPSRP